jgi:glycosyltransferase involved in cell wall biosynthesis
MTASRRFSSRSRRLAVVASHPIQYFVPVYRRLAERADIDIEVFYCSDFGVTPQFDAQFGKTITWDVDLLSGYSFRFLKNVSPFHDTFNPLHAVNPGVVFEMLRSFDALWVNGYLYPTNWLAAFTAKARRTRLLYRSDMRLFESRPDRWFDWGREWVLRNWIKRADALLYVGTANRRAYEHYGARDEQLVFCPYSVDNDAFRIGDRHDQRRTRAKWNLPESAIIVLVVGKLLKGKRPAVLLEVCTRLRHLGVHGVFAGSGPEESVLRERVAKEAIDNVTFLGFVNQRELPEVYSSADVFLFPSQRDQWGLVLNEACAAGLPAVVSSGVGAAPDLVLDGESGFICPVDPVSLMVEKVALLAKDRSLRERMGRAAWCNVQNHSLDATAIGIVTAVSG